MIVMASRSGGRGRLHVIVGPETDTDADINGYVEAEASDLLQALGSKDTGIRITFTKSEADTARRLKEQGIPHRVTWPEHQEPKQQQQQPTEPGVDANAIMRRRQKT